LEFRVSSFKTGWCGQGIIVVLDLFRRIADNSTIPGLFDEGYKAETYENSSRTHEKYVRDSLMLIILKLKIDAK
jgi:hypothetical protein